MVRAEIVALGGSLRNEIAALRTATVQWIVGVVLLNAAMLVGSGIAIWNVPHKLARRILMCAGKSGRVRGNGTSCVGQARHPKWQDASGADQYSSKISLRNVTPPL